MVESVLEQSCSPLGGQEAERARDEGARDKIYSYLFIYFYSYVHTMLGSFLPPAPTPSLTTHPLDTRQELFCPYL
jgi:hypothetical protein